MSIATRAELEAALEESADNSAFEKVKAELQELSPRRLEELDEEKEDAG